MATCGHGHIQFQGPGGRGRALCADCGADVTAREQRADHWRGVFDRSHPYEVFGPDQYVVAQFSAGEWNGDRVCRCAEIAMECATCQAGDLAGHDDYALSAWHRAGHPAEIPRAKAG